jgi:hypothetical protein
MIAWLHGVINAFGGKIKINLPDPLFGLTDG